MTSKAHRLAITRAPWSDQAARQLADVLGDDLVIVADEVERGLAELWTEPGGGYLVTRVERYLPYAELVLVAGAGRDYLAFVSAFIERARQAGIDRVRVHTDRPGVRRWLDRLGFDQTETVHVLRLAADG